MSSIVCPGPMDGLIGGRFYLAFAAIMSLLGVKGVLIQYMVILDTRKENTKNWRGDFIEYHGKNHGNVRTMTLS